MPTTCLPSDRERETDEARCVCGSLLARVTPSGVEVKCRRCKRVILIPFAPDEPEREPRQSPSTNKR